MNLYTKDFNFPVQVVVIPTIWIPRESYYNKKNREKKEKPSENPWDETERYA